MRFEPPIKDWRERTDHRGRQAMRTVAGCRCAACLTAQWTYLAQVRRDPPA